MDAGAWVVIFILAVVVFLALAAAIAPLLKKYKLQAPIKKIPPKKKISRRPKKRKKNVWIKIL